MIARCQRASGLFCGKAYGGDYLVAELVRSGHAVALLPIMAEPNLRLWGVKRLEFEPMRAYRREIGIAWHPRLVSIRPQSESVLAGLKEIEA